MPMLKTITASDARATGIKRRLEKAQRDELDRCEEELRLFESGEVELPQKQVELIREYLAAGSRCLAVDVSPDLPTEIWAQQMDLTRMRYGHDIPWRKDKKCRTYYHFLLSPALDDGCSLETLRSYARDWAEENFRSNGRLCEYAIIYRYSNDKGILRAHIVVNATNKATGRKLHFNNSETTALQVSAQEIGVRYGLTPLRKKMEATIGTRTQQPVHAEMAERALLDAGKSSWKRELRETIAQAAAVSSGFEDFKARLQEQGCDVALSKKEGRLTYTHSSGKRARDSSLGSLFYMESLEEMFNKGPTAEV